jgi:DegV family protein with EDD domain
MYKDMGLKGKDGKMKTTLIVDSCCDLAPGLLHLPDVRLASFLIDVEEEHFVDGPELSTIELLSRMRASKNAVKTSCPSLQNYLEEMRTSEESCFVVTVSSRLSGSYNAAMAARCLALEEFPEKKIHVFDTKSAASGETCTALRIQDCLERGLGFEETVEDVSSYIDTLHTFFLLKNFDNLMKTGRLSRIRGLLGMVQIGRAHV